MTILESIYNFFSRISEGYEELRRYEGKFVDVLAGTMTPEEVMKIVLLVAKEKEFINEDGNPSLTPKKPTLFHCTRRNQMVRRVDFNHYFTEEELNTSLKNFGFKSVTFASIQVDDATGEVVFADYTRGSFNEED